MWKYVFNTSLVAKSNSRNFYEKIVRESGYNMFVWNGEIYRVPAVGEDFLSQPLRLKVEEIR